jgi:hypothetical protein
MDLPEEWRQVIVAWAEHNPCVREVWLFGSRAKGNPKKNDVDIAIYLTPPACGNWPSQQKFATNSAAQMETEFGDVWQRELASAIDHPVSLKAVPPGSELDKDVRTTGVCLWTRP